MHNPPHLVPYFRTVGLPSRV